MTTPAPHDEPEGRSHTETAVASHPHQETVCPSCHKAELQHVRVTECLSCGFRKVEPEDTSHS